MTKKVCKEKCFNCEIVAKNVVIFKRWDGVKDEKLWEFTKKPNFYEEIDEKHLDLRYTLAEKRGWYFWKGMGSYPNALCETLSIIA